MFRFVTPVILIAISISLFYLFINPLYNGPDGITNLKSQVVSYNEALNNSKALEAERDKLTQKDNSIDPKNKDKLLKLLPDSVDNIRLILEIEQLAVPYGMVLRDVKYDTIAKADKTTAVAPVQGGVTTTLGKSYGTWNLQFSTSGNYANFLNFLKDVESNLRIVDISSIVFDSGQDVPANPALIDYYKYNFSIRTYWLKN